MFYWNWARLPATMVAVTASVVVSGQPIRYELLKNIVNNSNVARYLLSWTITLSLAMIFPSEEGGGDKQMYLCRRPFLMAKWTCWSDARGIPQCSMARATLDAHESRHCVATHSVLPRRPPGRQQTKHWLKCTHFAGCFDGRGGATVGYRAHHPMKEVYGFHKSH